MSYIQKNLLPDEKLFYTTHKHWIIFLFPAVCSIIALILLTQKELLLLLGYLISFIALYYWLTAFISYLTSEFAVTDKRVLIKTGFVRRQTWETLLSKIATLEVEQTIIGRMLNFGTLIIQSTGGSKDGFTWIHNPLILRSKVQEQTEKMQVNLSTAAPANLQAEKTPEIKPQGRERL